MELEFDFSNFGKSEAPLCFDNEKRQEVFDNLCNATGKGSDFLGWRDLPCCISEEETDIIKKTSDLVRKKADVLVVIGIGGSYLGAKAVISALTPYFDFAKHPHHKCEVVYAGCNLSQDYIADLIDYLKHKEYCLCVISKSGTTTEPAIAFRLLRAELEKKYGKLEAKDRIIAITDRQKGALRQESKENGYLTFEIRDDVGGRFSVLSPVGLLPVAVAGADIEELLAGARQMRDELINDQSENNPAYRYAAIRNSLYSQGKKIEALVAYEPCLQYFIAWWQQLFGESEGKQLKGLFPVGLNNTTDLHSLGQYVQQGERILFETVLKVAESRRQISIPVDANDLDGLNYLTKYSLESINHIAQKATSKAHTDGGVPQIGITIPRLDARSMGELIYFFEFACALSAYLLGVNPFDQPGVEDYKRNMFDLLGKNKK